MTDGGRHCERLKGAWQSPLMFFMPLGKVRKGHFHPFELRDCFVGRKTLLTRNDKMEKWLLRRHESKAPPRNDWLEKRLFQSHKVLLRNDGIGKALKARLFQSHKVLLRNDVKKSHCEAMILPFMAVAIAVMIFLLVLQL